MVAGAEFGELTSVSLSRPLENPTHQGWVLFLSLTCLPGSSQHWPVFFLNVIRICLFFNAILVADACALERRASQGPHPTAELTEGLGFNCALEALNPELSEAPALFLHAFCSLPTLSRAPLLSQPLQLGRGSRAPLTSMVLNSHLVRTGEEGISAFSRALQMREGGMQASSGFEPTYKSSLFHFASLPQNKHSFPAFWVPS